MNIFSNKRRQCQEKRRFGSKPEAQREILRLTDESLGGLKGLRSYKCKYCKHWHLTSK